MRMITSTTISRATTILLFILAATTVFAQTPPALSGRVIDGNGDVVPGAQVVLESRDNFFRTETVTDSNGTYSFTGLRNGDYIVTVSASSFASLTRTQSVPVDGPVDLLVEVGVEAGVAELALVGAPD